MSAREPIAEHPAVQRHRLRAKLERVVDRLLSAMDAIDGDGDLEPSLGFLEAGSLYSPQGLDQTHIAEGLGDDLEGEHDGREPPEDAEDTLGRSENIDQVRREFGQDDKEPSLGSVDHPDQRAWGLHQDGWAPFLLDHEEQCEDEGAQCDDEGHDSDREPDLFHTVPEYADGGMDQTRFANSNPGVQPSPYGAR
jgi:hypothetical protein